MDRNRLWVLGAVLLIGATAVLGWTLGISPKLTQASVADADRAAIETQNSAYEAQVATLKKQFEGIGDLKSNLAALRLAVPSAAEIPAFITQLDAIGQQHQVTLTDIKVNDAQLYVPVAAAASTAPSAVAPGTADATPAAGGTPPPAAAAPVVPTVAEAAAALAPKPSALVTAANFVYVPVTLTIDGSYGNVLDFIEGLQKGTRLVLVTTFSTSPAVAPAPVEAEDTSAGTVPGASDAVTATISAIVYVLLDLNAAVAAPAG